MKLYSEGTSKILAWIGISLLIIGVGLFFWNDYSFNTANKIDASKVGQFGDFVGGLIGSVWALAGVILFYVALTEQRKDSKTNQEVLRTQVEALEQQIKEFELQRNEMQLSREVYKEQSTTLKLQQFESTFFNSLSLLNNIIESISIEDINGRESLKTVYFRFEGIYKRNKANHVESLPLLENEKLADTGDFKGLHNIIVSDSYHELFRQYQSSLGHYFRTMYNIIQFIDDRTLEDSKYYINLVKAQLSTYEHLLLFYNCLSKREENFKRLIIKHSLLDNLDINLLLDTEHQSFYPISAY